MTASEKQGSPTQKNTSSKKNVNVNFTEKSLLRTIIPWEDVVLKQRDLNSGTTTSNQSFSKNIKQPKKPCQVDKENAKQAISLMYKNARKAFRQNRLPAPNPNNMVSFKFNNFSSTEAIAQSTTRPATKSQIILLGSFGPHPDNAVEPAKDVFDVVSSQVVLEKPNLEANVSKLLKQNSPTDTKTPQFGQIKKIARPITARS